MEAQHVHHADRRQGRAEQIGSLIQRCADEQSAVAAASNGQLIRPRVSVGDEPLRRGDKIAEHIWLLQLHPGPVPFLAVFAAPPQTGLRVNAAHFHPDEVGDRESRREADVEPSVAVEQRGIGAVHLQPLPVRDEHRNARVVLAPIEDLLGFIVAGVEIHFRLAKHRALAVVQIEPINRPRHREARE